MDCRIEPKLERNMVDDNLIAETDYISRADGVHGQHYGETPKTGEVLEGMEIVATKKGIIARFGGDGGYIQDEVSATWTDVLKHVPTEELENEIERRGSWRE